MGVTAQALKDRPELDYPQTFMYNMFNELSGSRGMSSVGPLGIPITEIKAYCEFFEVRNLDEKAHIFRFVSHLDGVYLKFVTDKQAAAK